MFNSSAFNSTAINDTNDLGNREVREFSTSTENISITSVITITETGVGVDAIVLGDLLQLEDTSTSTEELSLQAAAALSETGIATDTLSLEISFPLNDTGAFNDSLSVTPTVIINDTAIGTDTLTDIAHTIVLQEAGTVVELFTANFSSVSVEGNKLNPDNYVELFDFDASMLLDRNGNAGTISYFTNTPTGGGVSPLWWRTNGYYPLPFEISGVESRGDGTAMARPTIAISNVNQFLLAAVLSLGDLVGMKVTRWRTFYKFTDNGEQPNINMHYPVDEWIVTRKIAHSKTGISFEMSNALDRPGLRLPRKQILTDQGFPGVSKVRLR